MWYCTKSQKFYILYPRYTLTHGGISHPQSNIQKAPLSRSFSFQQIPFLGYGLGLGLGLGLIAYCCCAASPPVSLPRVAARRSAAFVVCSLLHCSLYATRSVTYDITTRLSRRALR